MEIHDLPLTQPSKLPENGILQLLNLPPDSTFQTIRKTFETKKKALELKCKENPMFQEELDQLIVSFDKFLADYKGNVQLVSELRKSLQILNSDPYSTFEEVEENYKSMGATNPNDETEKAYNVLSKHKDLLSNSTGKRGGLLLGISLVAAGGVSLAALSALRGSKFDEDENLVSDVTESSNKVNFEDMDLVNSEEMVQRELMVSSYSEGGSEFVENLSVEAKVSSLHLMIKGI
jgi:hypothetical protein